MSSEESLKNASESLGKLNGKELGLDESAKIYKEGLKSIEKVRLTLGKARLEVEQIDEQDSGFAVSNLSIERVKA